LLLRFGIAVQRLERAAFDDRDFVSRKLVLREQVAHFHLDQVKKLGVIDHVDLVQEDTIEGTPTWRASRRCSRVCASGRPLRSRPEWRRPFGPRR